MTKKAEMRGKIVFISHDAHRTGAPMVLLHLIRWIKRNTSISFKIILRDGGEMLGDFAELGPTVSFSQENQASWDARATSLEEFLRDDFRLIYSNTAVNGDVLERLSHMNVPVISHIHELEHMIRDHIGYELFDQVKRYSSHFIAGSNAVKQNLIERHGLSGERIHVVYEFIEMPDLDLCAQARSRARIRRELGIPAEAFVVGGAGTTDWRKGPDLFVQLAYAIRKRVPKSTVHYVWVGGDAEGYEYRQLWHDVTQVGMQTTMHFLGSRENPCDYFTAVDVFVSTSREDPFPLVCLEAGALGKPILCFDKAGGMQELISNDCGFVIPYLDLEEMAEKVIFLTRSAARVQDLGATLAEKIRQGHDVSVGAQRVMRVIELALAETRAVKAHERGRE